MAEILLGLDYLHSLNIIHADLNPENIIISAHGHVKLINPVFLRGLEQVTSLSAARRPSLGGSPGCKALIFFAR